MVKVKIKILNQERVGITIRKKDGLMLDSIYTKLDAKRPTQGYELNWNPSFKNDSQSPKNFGFVL